MNKNDILRIARSLYLQQTIARQLFAKFDINKELNDLDGSFAKLIQKLSSAFYCFIGSTQDPRSTYGQIIQKNGMKFKIHKMNTDNSVSNQIYKNSQFDINQISFVLTKLYITVQKGGQLSFKSSVNLIQKLWDSPLNENPKKAANRGQTIIDKLQQIKQYFIGISDFVVGDIQYIDDIRELQDDLFKLKDQDFFGADTPQYDIFDNKLRNFVANFKLLINNNMSFAKTIDNSLNRLKAFIQLYKQILNRLDKQHDDRLVAILNALQMCNNNTQLSRELSKINVKKQLGIDNYDVLPHTIYEAIKSFIKFVKSISSNQKDRIQFTNLNVAIQYYLDLQDGVLSDNAKTCLAELKEYASKIEKNNKVIDQMDLQGKDHILYTNQISDDLVSKIKNCSQQFV